MALIGLIFIFTVIFEHLENHVVSFSFKSHYLIHIDVCYDHFMFKCIHIYVMNNSDAMYL